MALCIPYQVVSRWLAPSTYLKSVYKKRVEPTSTYANGITLLFWVCNMHLTIVLYQRHKKRANLLQFTLSFQERLIMTLKPSHLSIVIIANLHWLSKQFYLFCLFQPIVNSSVFIINRFPNDFTMFLFVW